MNKVLILAEELLRSVKNGTSSELPEKGLAELEYAELAEQLVDDAHRLVFWINVYNAYFQILRKQTGLTRPRIFTKRAIHLAGGYWSLDDIEHGILRRYRYKYSLGYFANRLTPQRVKKLAVNNIDYRIHFALNCGAVSCPPIVIYKLTDLEEQLNQSSQSFMLAETIIDQEKKTARVSRILFWFMKDFGGLHGIRTLLAEVFQLPAERFRIKFNKYSWTDKLDNFV